MKRERCPDCRMPYQREGEDRWCSNFCATVPEKDRRAWQTAKNGDWAVYPCKVCGCAIEDELAERVCSTCWPTERLERLLRQCVKHVPDALKKKIREAVRR